MSDFGITINLNDASVQDFDTEGRPTSMPNMDEEMLAAYAAMVDSFERHITAEGPQDGLSYENEREIDAFLRAIDELVDNRSPHEQQHDRPQETPPPSNQDSGSGSSSNDGGNSGQPPDVPGLDDLFDDPLPSAAPDVNGVSPFGPGGGTPPPGGGGAGAAGAAGGAAEAAGGLGMLMGPEVGVALMVAADTIDLLIGAFEGLVEITHAVDDAMESLVDDIRPFSGEVATADAMRDVNNLLINMDRADKLGPDVAKWIETRTEIDTALGTMATDISRLLLPLVQRGTEAILDGLTILQLIGDDLSDFPLILQKIGELAEREPIAALVMELLKTTHEGLREIRREREQKRAEQANNALSEFRDFLTKQALPIQGLGGAGGGQQIVGGLEP